MIRGHTHAHGSRGYIKDGSREIYTNTVRIASYRPVRSMWSVRNAFYDGMLIYTKKS